MVEMSCEEHDQYAASSQFVTHLTGRMLSKVHTRQYYLPVCTRESQPPLRCATLRRASLNAHALRHCTRQADRPVCLFATSPQRACGLCLRFVLPAATQVDAYQHQRVRESLEPREQHVQRLV
jgi:hypothetical protein